MSFIELLLLSVSLSMDTFAISVSSGFAMPTIKKRYATILGVYFGFFQFLMPMLGYFLSVHFYSLIKDFDHWIAFVLLAAIGLNMLKESFDKKEKDSPNIVKSLEHKKIITLAIATSIDALAIGVSFACLQDIDILFSCIVIGIVTFCIAFTGVILGKKISTLFQNDAKRIGGIVLICIGLKILIQHLFFGA